MTCWPHAESWSLCSSVPSWPSAMIRLEAAGGPILQLRLELAESPAPAVALWELVGAQQREAAMTLLAALIAQTLAPEATGDERVPLRGAGTVGRDD
jgi:hypothetical protein